VFWGAAGTALMLEGTLPRPFFFVPRESGPPSEPQRVVPKGRPRAAPRVQNPAMRPRSRPRSAFTLVEAVVSTAITAVAGSAILLGLSSALQTTNDVLDQAIAQGIADQLADEIAGKRYSAAADGPYQTSLGPSAYEAAGVNRERYDDIDDFNGYSAKPVCDDWGVTLGLDDGQGGQRQPNFQISPTFFNLWRITVNVFYVDPTNLSKPLTQGQTSDYRCAQVTVLLDDPRRGSRQLAASQRVFAYVPTP